MLDGAKLTPAPPAVGPPCTGTGACEVLASVGRFLAIIKRDNRRVILLSVLRFCWTEHKPIRVKQNLYTVEHTLSGSGFANSISRK
jgi:hypothetical protein